MVGGKFLETLMVFGGAVSAIGFAVCALCTTSRALQGMCTLGCFPQKFNKVFGKIDTEHGTPANAIILNGFITFLLSVTMDFSTLVTIEQVLYALRLIMVLSCLLVLRIRHPSLERPYQIPGGISAIVVLIIPPTLWGILLICGSVTSHNATNILLVIALSVITSIATTRNVTFDGRITSLTTAEVRRRKVAEGLARNSPNIV